MPDLMEMQKQFLPYLKKGVFGFLGMTSNEALVEDAPEEAKSAFDSYVKEVKKMHEEGIWI